MGNRKRGNHSSGTVKAVSLSRAESPAASCTSSVFCPQDPASSGPDANSFVGWGHLFSAWSSNGTRCRLLRAGATRKPTHFTPALNSSVGKPGYDSSHMPERLWSSEFISSRLVIRNLPSHQLLSFCKTTTVGRPPLTMPWPSIFIKSFAVMSRSSVVKSVENIPQEGEQE